MAPGILSRSVGARPVWPAAAALLALVAYAPLFWEVPTFRSQVVEGWLFDPGRPPAAMVLALCGWLVWRRRAALAALPPTTHPVAALPLLLLGLLCAAWAKRAGAPDWLIFSLLAGALAFAVAARGAPALRWLALPGLVLLFAVPIPDPLENELVWWLQRASARAALWLHHMVGLDTVGEGVWLQRGESGFLVIEACSGLRTVITLMLVAIVVRELFVHVGARAWWLVVLAPPLALAINAVRVAWIATGEAGASPEGHVGQGVAMLLAGTALLFLSGQALARGACPRDPPAAAGSGAGWPWRGACLALVAVIGLQLAVPARDVSRPPPFELVERFRDRRGWEGETLPVDYEFIGRLAIGQSLQRRFVRSDPTGQMVELFVAIAHRDRPRESPWSDKLLLPGRDWSLVESASQRDWRLFRDVQVAVAARGEQRALVQTWTLGDAGFWRETLFSFLALRGAAFADWPQRVVVRLATPILGESPTARERARAVLNRFVVDFGADLEALEAGSGSSG